MFKTFRDRKQKKYEFFRVKHLCSERFILESYEQLINWGLFKCLDFISFRLREALKVLKDRAPGELIPSRVEELGGDDKVPMVVIAAVAAGKFIDTVCYNPVTQALKDIEAENLCQMPAELSPALVENPAALSVSVLRTRTQNLRLLQSLKKLAICQAKNWASYYFL